MTKSYGVRGQARRFSALVQAAVLAGVALMPAVLLSSQASGAQLTSRFIDMSANQTSEGSGRDSGDAAGQDVSYRVGFTLPSSSTFQGIVVNFCNNSPIVGDSCTAPTGFSLDPTGAYDPGAGADSVALDLDAQSGISGFTIDTVNSDDNTLILTGSAAALTGAVTFDLGSIADDDGIYNPSVNGTFYARILLYATSGAAQAYDPVTTGTYLHDGGVALAVADELTISARVQEVLQFCVGSEDAGTNSDCSDISGTAINLGVVESSDTAETDNSPARRDGKAMIRTNAFNGAAIYYKAEQNTASGKLKVNGATCTGSLTTDQCFNSAGTTKQAIVDGVEMFGMTVFDIDLTNGAATTNLQCDTEYNGDGTCSGGAPTGYAWDDTGNFDRIAFSTSVLDDEMLQLRFAATASPTTPTGLYTVTANFVATATF